MNVDVEQHQSSSQGLYFNPLKKQPPAPPSPAWTRPWSCFRCRTKLVLLAAVEHFNAPERSSAARAPSLAGDGVLRRSRGVGWKWCQHDHRPTLGARRPEARGWRSWKRSGGPGSGARPRDQLGSPRGGGGGTRRPGIEIRM